MVGKPTLNTIWRFNWSLSAEACLGNYENFHRNFTIKQQLVKKFSIINLFLKKFLADDELRKHETTDQFPYYSLLAKKSIVQ